MSINAIVKAVRMNEDGSGCLILEGEERGQPSLCFESAPEEVTALTGKQVWGGADTLMHGETKIARRDGYCGIVFVDGETFKRAIADESKRKREMEEWRKYHDGW